MLEMVHIERDWDFTATKQLTIQVRPSLAGLFPSLLVDPADDFFSPDASVPDQLFGLETLHEDSTKIFQPCAVVGIKGRGSVTGLISGLAMSFRASLRNIASLRSITLIPSLPIPTLPRAG